MARELSDPDIAGMASQIVMKGQPPVIPPRGPIKPTAPDSGPLPGMSPMPQGHMYIPGASVHEVVRIDEGAAMRVIEYPVGTGAWQSRSHSGQVSRGDDSLREQGDAPPGPEMSGSPDECGYPTHSSEGEMSGMREDSNAKSYDSPPVSMDYSGDNRPAYSRK